MASKYCKKDNNNATMIKMETKARAIKFITDVYHKDGQHDNS